MRIDKLEQMVYALDLLIDRYKGREQDSRTFTSFRNEIYDFYRGMLYPYCGYTMSKTIIRNELTLNLGEVQADCLCMHMF